MSHILEIHGVSIDIPYEFEYKEGILTVKYPNITIQNNEGLSKYLGNVYAYFRLDKGGNNDLFALTPLFLKRDYYDYKDFLVSGNDINPYIHSHVKWYNGNSTLKFCFGSSPLGSFMDSIIKKENIPFTLSLFKRFLEWESIEGVPYYYLRDVLSNGILNIVSNKLVGNSIYLEQAVLNYLNNNIDKYREKILGGIDILQVLAGNAISIKISLPHLINEIYEALKEKIGDTPIIYDNSSITRDYIGIAFNYYRFRNNERVSIQEEVSKWKTRVEEHTKSNLLINFKGEVITPKIEFSEEILNESLILDHSQCITKEKFTDTINNYLQRDNSQVKMSIGYKDYPLIVLLFLNNIMLTNKTVTYV